MIATIEATNISIHDIRRDGGTQPRAELDENHIEDLVYSLKQNVEFEAILLYFDGINYWLTDGFHRLAATIRCGKDKIKAFIRQGTLEDAQWHSFSVNQHYALKRSNSDKQRAIAGALKHKFGFCKSNEEIARHCGVDPKTVRLWRAKLEESGEISTSEYREVNRLGQSYQYNIPGRCSSTTNNQEFRVISPDIPDYYGQTVELIEVKGNGCYQCKTKDGKIYPFLKSELGSTTDKKAEPLIESFSTLVNNQQLDDRRSQRQRLIGVILRLPESVLPEAEKLLIEKYGDVMSDATFMI